MAERKRSSPWSDLPEVLLYTILTLLPSIRDLVCFSSVCRSWRSFVSSTHSSSLFPPLLFNPILRGRSRSISSLQLYDPAYPFLIYPLSLISTKQLSAAFLTCSNGHLLFFSGNLILVINPFTGKKILSPVVTKDFNFKNSTAALLTNSLLVFSRDFLFEWQIGSSEWLSSQWFNKFPNMAAFQSCYIRQVITIKHKIYAIDSLSRIHVYDPSLGLTLRNLDVDCIGQRVNSSIIDWLVDFGGELLYLQFEDVQEEIMDAKSTAYKLEMSNWVKMESLGDYAIFVGLNSTVPGFAIKNPERWGGRRNCIYFAKSIYRRQCVYYHPRNNIAEENEAWDEIEFGVEIDTSEPESPLWKSDIEKWPSSLWLCPKSVL